MSRPNALLADNALLFTRAMAASHADPLTYDYAAELDPTRSRADLLPILAHDRSVRLWFSDWSIARQRLMVQLAVPLAALEGTRAAAAAYLPFVDGVLVDALRYPSRPFAGRAFADRAIADAPPWKARYLVRVPSLLPAHAAVAGRAFAGRTFARRLDLEPIRRAIAALRVAKSDAAEVRVDFQNWRPLRAGDAVPAGGGYRAGQHLQRSKL
ncbi:MAG: hypothetical protein C0447_09655 [Methylobacterium sp.]|nr:hypothetical protein [Methylobacterium sp.]